MICECGMLVTGISEKHLKLNIKNHKKSKKHKELTALKKVQENALKHENKGVELTDEQSNPKNKKSKKLSGEQGKSGKSGVRSEK